MDICYVNKNKHKVTPSLRSDKFHFFSKIHIKNNTAINITEKAKYLTQSVNQILEDLNSLRDKDLPTQNKKVGSKKINFHSPIKKKYRKMLIEPLSRHAITNDKAFANMIKYSNFSDPYSPKKGNEGVEAKQEKIKRVASRSDLRNERVMKRLGGASDGFLNSILMNTDKNFNLKKFLEVNMYSIVKQKKQDTNFVNYLKNLEEQPIKKEQKVESLDFSINEDIDKINKIINNERAIFESITNDQNKASNNDLIRIEEYNDKYSIIENNFRRSSKMPIKFTKTLSPSIFQNFSQFKKINTGKSQNSNIIKIQPLKTSTRNSRNNPRPFSMLDETSHKKSDSMFKNTKINFNSGNGKQSFKTIDIKTIKNKKYSTTAKDFYKPKLNINIANTGNINDFIKIENQQMNSNRQAKNTISPSSKFLQSSHSNSDVKVNMTFNKFKKSKISDIPEIEKLGTTLHRVTSSTEIKTMLRFIKSGSRKNLD